MRIADSRSTSLALLSVAAATLAVTGVLVNLLIDSPSVPSSTWFNIGTLSLGFFGATTAALLSRASYKQARRISFQTERDLAVLRIRATLERSVVDNSEAFSELTPLISVDVKPFNRSSITAVTSSVFLTRLEDDPSGTVITGPNGSGKSALLLRFAWQMAGKYQNGRAPYVPLLIQCKSWTGETTLPGWVSRETSSYFDISPRITRSWLRSGAALLLLDGVDEVENSLRASFVSQLNQWFTSPTGGRAVLTCRSDSYVQWASKLKHYQVASLQPPTTAQAREYLSLSLHSSRQERYPEWARIIDLISSEDESDELRKPLLLHYLRRGIEDAYRRASRGDEAWPAEQFDSFVSRLLADDSDSAQSVREYLRKFSDRDPSGGVEARVRASLILAQAGHTDRAETILREAVSDQLQRSFEDKVIPLDAQLSLDEKEVLNALPHGRALSAIQIGNAARLAPSECHQALRCLRDRGLVRVVEDNSEGEPRFRRSSTDLDDC